MKITKSILIWVFKNMVIITSYNIEVQLESLFETESQFHIVGLFQ